MNADTRGAFTGTGTSVSVAIASTPFLGSNSYCLVAVGVSADFAVSSITATSGTFVKLTAVAGAPRLELWLGYNFGTGVPTSVTVTRAAGTANMVVLGRAIDVDGNAAVAPTTAVSTPANGTSASGTSGAVTPAVGDILFAALAMNSITADSTARVNTGNTYWSNSGIELTSIRVEAVWGLAQAAVSSSEAWTLAASATWVGAQATITPAAPPTPTVAKLVKGHTTDVLDAASIY